MRNARFYADSGLYRIKVMLLSKMDNVTEHILEEYFTGDHVITTSLAVDLKTITPSEKEIFDPALGHFDDVFVIFYVVGPGTSFYDYTLVPLGFNNSWQKVIDKLSLTYAEANFA